MEAGGGPVVAGGEGRAQAEHGAVSVKLRWPCDGGHLPPVEATERGPNPMGLWVTTRQGCFGTVTNVPLGGALTAGGCARVGAGTRNSVLYARFCCKPTTTLKKSLKICFEPTHSILYSLLRSIFSFNKF